MERILSVYRTKMDHCIFCKNKFSFYERYISKKSFCQNCGLEYFQTNFGTIIKSKKTKDKGIIIFNKGSFSTYNE